MHLMNYFIIFLLYFGFQAHGNVLGDEPSLKNNDLAHLSKETGAQAVSGASQHYFDAISSAISKTAWPDPITSEFLYSTAPQEIRDFVEVINNILGLYVSGKHDKQLLFKMIPKRLLLVGPPGVGKSTLALVISEKLKRGCYFIRMPMLGSEYQNSDTSNLARFITDILSYNKPCVLVMDEINIYAEKKSSMGTDLNTASVLWLLLDKCAQNPNILIIGTCNNAAEIAPQLKDRFEGSVIEIPAISSSQRFDILCHYLSKLKHNCSRQQILALAEKTNDFSPRQLEALINSAYQQSVLRAVGGIIFENDLDKAYAKFQASSRILNSRLGSLKKWVKENGPIISSLTSAINLGVLLGSMAYVACSSLLKVNKNTAMPQLSYQER